jgi:hypothetical protein
MKKLTSTLSPFLVLIFPVLIFVSISYILDKQAVKTNTQMPSYIFGATPKKFINTCQKTIITLRLK